MLTIEIINGNEALASLPDETKQLIAQMSENDENNTIGARIGQLHGQYDADILNASGIAKNSGEKSYDYAKRVISELKAKGSNDELNAQLKDANAEVTRLKEQLAKGGDAETKRQLKDAHDQIARLQSEAATTKANHDKAMAEANKALSDTKLGYAYDLAISKIKFKDGVTAAMQSALLAAAKTEVMSKGTPEIQQDGGVVFRDAEGKLLLNPANGSNPYTMAELVLESACLKDAIDNGRKQTGGGTNSNDDGHADVADLDLSGVKTRTEADELIRSHLFAKGMVVGKEMSDEMARLRKELGVSKLPIQ